MMGSPARRILMTTDAVGGVWVYATDLAHALCKAGHEVTLVVMGPHPSVEQLFTLGNIGGLTVEITDLALEWMDPEGKDIARAQKQLRVIADRVRPDVVHLNSYREAAFEWPAPVLVVAHSCVWSWWRACRGGAPDEARWRRYAEGVASGLLGADAWVAPTAAFRDLIESFYTPPRRGHVIHNCMELVAATLPKERVVLAAGRLWDEAKNLSALAGIAPQLDWPVRAAGPMQSPSVTVEERAVDEIEFLGVLSRPQMIAQMRTAGIFASPAIYEPFGLSILEAAACGCALVLGDIPTLRELWNGAALFVEPHDREALAQTLQRLCRDDTLRTRMQFAARTRASGYSLEKTVRAYGDLYDTMRQAPVHARQVCSPEMRVEVPV